MCSSLYDSNYCWLLVINAFSSSANITLGLGLLCVWNWSTILYLTQNTIFQKLNLFLSIGEKDGRQCLCSVLQKELTQYVDGHLSDIPCPVIQNSSLCRPNSVNDSPHFYLRTVIAELLKCSAFGIRDDGQSTESSMMCNIPN